MNTILITLALVSVAAAVALAVLAWRMRAEHRRRSAARVAALAAAIGDTDPPAYVTRADRIAVGALFDRSTDERMMGRPSVRTAIVAALVVALIGFSFMVRGGGSDAADAAAEAAASVELVSMRHTRAGRALTVTGLVRNPATRPLIGVEAVLFAFDRHGDFVASARASLEFSTLEPGDQSPFAVTLREVADVGRYRVSFRTGAGLLRHIDTRNPNQVVMVQR